MKLIAAALALAPSFAAAATIASDPVEPLLQRDPLGYECIAENDLELGFATNKGASLPQTCRFDPCADLLDRDRWAREVVGLVALTSDSAWADFRHRQAMYCDVEYAANYAAEPDTPVAPADAPLMAIFFGTNLAPVPGRVPSPGQLVGVPSASTISVIPVPGLDQIVEPTPSFFVPGPSSNVPIAPPLPPTMIETPVVPLPGGVYYYLTAMALMGAAALFKRKTA